MLEKRLHDPTGYGQRFDVELRAPGDGSDQAGRSGRAQGIAVPTFKPDPGEMRSVSEPPARGARAFHIKPLVALLGRRDDGAGRVVPGLTADRSWLHDRAA